MGRLRSSSHCRRTSGSVALMADAVDQPDPASGTVSGSASAPNRLLIVSSHFPPDRSAGTHRVLRLANYLQMHGWETSVLTIEPASYRDSIQQDDSLVEEPIRA